MPEEVGNGYLKTIVKGAGIVFIGLFVSKILSYLFRIFIARYFGLGDYGLFSLGLAVLSFFATFAILGLQTGVIRYTAHYRAKGDKKRVKGVITSSIKLVLPASVIMSFLMLISSPYLAINVFKEPELVNVLLILSLSIPFSALFAVLVSVFTGFKQIKYKVCSESFFINLAKLVFIIAFGAWGFGVVGIAWAWTIATILALMLSAYFLKKVYPIFRTKVVSIPMKKELLSYSLPLLFTASMSFFVLWTDTLMLGYFKNVSDVGIYNAAMPTAQLLIMFPNALAALFLPIITELHAKNKIVELKKVYKTVTRWTFYINFPMFLLLVFFSRQVLNLLFGPEYITGYIPLIILSMGLMFRKSVQSVRILEMLKKTRNILYIVILTTVLNVSLNYLLIPLYGMRGAAIATMVTYVAAFFLYFFFSYRFSKMTPLSLNMMKAVVAGITSIAIVHSAARLLFASFSIYILAGLFLAFLFLYGFILLLLRSFNKEDIEIMKTIERKSGLKIEFLRNVLKRFM